jgi:SnoaL-like domain
MTPLDIAVAFTKAWTSHDMVTAAGYVADDVVFEGPLSEAVGQAAFMDGLTRFAEAVTGADILSAVGDGERAIVMYDVSTRPFGVIKAAEEFVVSGGKICRNTLVFDTYEVRMVRAAQADAK